MKLATTLVVLILICLSIQVALGILFYKMIFG